ncbi:hypothetical protein [Rothia kristinae]|uniref:hypothetical protein n=1 Tax=Rothia kristinae TaxID=37923 RepID=UPI0013F4C380|nr:hypothetical protein [Rothia kristinae]
MPSSAAARTRPVRAAALLGTAALLLAGCAPAPPEDSDIASDHADYTGCIVSDPGGFDDRSFNQNFYEAVPYSTLTLPTIHPVSVSVVLLFHTTKP